MLLATLLGLAVLPLLNGWLVTPPPGAACCSVERWFSSEPLLRVASAVLHRVGISVAPRQVVVGRGWPRRAHLDVVALAAQGAHLLHRIGADAVAHRRVGAHHQDPIGHGMASRAASMRSRVAGQV